MTEKIIKKENVEYKLTCSLFMEWNRPAKYRFKLQQREIGKKKMEGFKEDVSSFYELVYKGGSGPEYEIDESYDAQNYNTDVYSISAPTQSIAQKWLRETKNLHITIYNSASGYTYDISKADMGTVLYCFPEGPNDGGNWDTYEEALEAGIIKALKLI